MKPPLDISAEQVRMLRELDVEAARKQWPTHILGAPMAEDVVLAGLHKARLKWSGSSKAMVRESKAWLREHGYGTDPNGPDPNVPQAANTGRRQ